MDMDRRGFLRGVALGAVTAGAPIALGSTVGREVAPENSLYPSTIYVEGTVVQRSANEVVLSDPEIGLSRVVLSAGTSIWKGVHTTADVVAGGDHLSLRGVPLADGAVEAVAVWVNIAWHRGTVTGLDGRAVSWQADNGTSGVFHVAGHTTLHRGDEPPQRLTGQLQVGHRVEALGAFDRPGGILGASKVWLFEGEHA
jgi:hypothetical protein